MHGGSRIGAGRKVGFTAKQSEEARKYISIRVSEEIEDLTGILIKKAKNGDLKAIQILLDRAWGRPRQEIHSVPNQEEIVVSPVIMELARRLNNV